MGKQKFFRDTRLPPAKDKALLHHQNNSQVYKLCSIGCDLNWRTSCSRKWGDGSFVMYGGLGEQSLISGSHFIQLDKDFGDTNFLGVVATKLCTTSYKKIRKRSKIVQRLVTIAGTGINFLGETAAQYLHPSLQICTLSHALLWKSVDFEEWSDRKTLDQNFSDLALQFSDRSIEFLYSSAVCLLPFRIKGNTPDWTM